MQSVFLTFSLVVVLGLFYINATPLIPNADKVEVYLKSNSSSCDIKVVSPKKANLIFDKRGESYWLEGSTFNLSNFLNKFNATIVMVESIDDGLSIYAYSSKVRYLKILKGKKVNLHIHLKQDVVRIGSPIIFGSF